MDTAEPYLLAAGKRDSARTLAQAYHQWLQPPENREAIGAFACRGTLPYELRPFPLHICALRAHFVSGHWCRSPSLPHFHTITWRLLDLNSEIGTLHVSRVQQG